MVTRDSDEWYEGLTEKRRCFCEAYASNGGNSAAAARAAGYKQPEPQGSRLIRLPVVAAALERLRETETRTSIATRQERQEFWSSVARDPEEQMKYRLKAAEMLGRSQADFVDRKEITGANGTDLQIAFYIPKNGREK